MDTRAFEAAMLRAQLFELAVIGVVLIVTIAIWYFVMKAAIRDGIQESGIVQALNRSAGRTPTMGEPAQLPDMRADR
jgi:hypothetical protein